MKTATEFQSDHYQNSSLEEKIISAAEKIRYFVNDYQIKYLLLT